MVKVSRLYCLEDCPWPSALSCQSTGGCLPYDSLQNLDKSDQIICKTKQNRKRNLFFPDNDCSTFFKFGDHVCGNAPSFHHGSHIVCLITIKYFVLCWGCSQHPEGTFSLCSVGCLVSEFSRAAPHGRQLSLAFQEALYLLC